MLNAFRHLGEGDAPLRQLADGSYDVLNAFRHLGEGDEGWSQRERERWRCSTPFGILAKGTGVAWRTQQGRLVLNAFRHLGEGDYPTKQHMANMAIVLNAFRHLGEGDPYL